ncbi:4Fe-4S dicluster domain-containing protein [bacterium]|nr:4Fe-4S dicluster domain-containing protein [bacterium]
MPRTPTWDLTASPATIRWPARSSPTASTATRTATPPISWSTRTWSPSRRTPATRATRSRRTTRRRTAASVTTGRMSSRSITSSATGVTSPATGIGSRPTTVRRGARRVICNDATRRGTMNLLDLVQAPEARVPRGPAPVPGIRELPDPEVVILPLEYPGQILFSPAVAVGDTVARHEVIGRSERGNCVHASIGGTVREIRTIWSARSHHVPAVVIERGDVPELTSAELMAREDLVPDRATRLEMLRAGGAISPWTTPGRDHREGDVAEYPEMTHIVIKGLNEEPLLHNFEVLLREHADTLADGIKRLHEFQPKARIHLTVRRGLVGWARERFGDLVEVVGLSTAYRHRLERLVVPRICGVDVPHNAAFRARGVAVLSTEYALAAIAALDGRPFTSKTLTVTGVGVDEPVVVRTRIGARVGDVLEALGVTVPTHGRVSIGGSMMGLALADLETPIDKFSHGIFLQEPADLPVERNLVCINCGRCTRACPVRLQVHLLGRSVEFDQLDTALAMQPEACLECGLCAFVCPSHRPLVQLVRIAKRYGRSEA